MLDQRAVDESNADYWNMLSGWSLAEAAGIDPRSDEDLRRFDCRYLDFYPYLRGYVDSEDLRGKRVLEIGLGYGTLGQLLASKGCEYHGVDIAPEPVALMRRRLRTLDGAAQRIQQASALDLPFPDEAFDYAYTIGCLHHTGNLERSVSEVHRVVEPGGRAVVMLYYRHSARRLVHALRRAVTRSGRSDDRLLSAYDVDEAGTLPPHTDFVSRSEARRLFRSFSKVRIEARNFDDYRLGPLVARRTWLLGNIARLVGLDLYITADK